MRARGIREAGERLFVRLFGKTPPSIAKLISDNENSRWEIIFIVDYKTNHIYIRKTYIYAKKTGIKRRFLNPFRTRVSGPVCLLSSFSALFLL
jgi:hypothetical protein